MKDAQLLSDVVVVERLSGSWEEETLPLIERLIASIVLSQGNLNKAMLILRLQISYCSKFTM